MSVLDGEAFHVLRGGIGISFEPYRPNKVARGGMSLPGEEKERRVKGTFLRRRFPRGVKSENNLLKRL